MSTSMTSHVHIYLVQPLNKKIYKEMIVYADSEQQARTAAAAVEDYEKKQSSENTFPPETVYLDTGMSICIEIKPNIIKVDNGHVKVKYNEVVYDLNKNEAGEVIAESVYKQE